MNARAGQSLRVVADKGQNLDLYDTIFELIDMRSFSNLWFWIGLAIMWSTASHWSMGVPYDLVTRAKRMGGQAEADLLDIARINTNRILYIAEVSGVLIFALACFAFAGLATLGFFYHVEFAQAVFLLLFPMSIVGTINYAIARRLRQQDLTLDRVAKALSRCRLFTQMIGMVSILVTSLWGMYQNFSIGVLG